MRAELALSTFAAAALAACGPSEPTASTSDATPAPAPTRAYEPAPPAREGFAQVDAKRLRDADSEPGQWLTYNGTYYEQHFSPLDQINESNVSQLGLAWFADLPTNQPIEGTPLFIDGVLYVTSPWSRVHAFDARSGEKLWSYDPEVPGEWNAKVCCGPDLRGVAAWEGRIIFGTLDGRLIALDAETGEPAWSVEATPRDWPYAITGAPRVANGKVYIGSAGGEFGVRGYLDAYDAETGERLWRWWTVPGNPADGFENPQMETAAQTWSGEWWPLGGGGPVWDSITYDPDTNLVLFGTGNGSPWSAVVRDPDGGDNLFLTSIVALDADTGEYRWHYQETPWETWDYDAGQQLTLVDLEIGGEMRHVVMQAAKNGFFYILDAATGELLSATPYTQINWATGVDVATGRPNEVTGARYDVEDEAWNILPGPVGAHAWQSMSYSPDTGLVYIPTTESYSPLESDPDFEAEFGRINTGTRFDAREDYYEANPDAPRGTAGRLVAWDPLAMREVWGTAATFAESRGLQVTGGALATGGNLVFHGDLANQELVAYRATDGERLWSMDTQTPVLAGAISYELDGAQYVALSVGGSLPGGYYAPNYARLLVFALGGDFELPEPIPFVQRPINPPPQLASVDVVGRGRDVYARTCAACHGQDGDARSTFPDLRRSPTLHSQQLFDGIVLEGALASNGMASFADQVDAADSEALRAYVISLAHEAVGSRGGGGVPTSPSVDPGK